jgi:alkanesulfonate monooxygenase SsuD/methylene tetrahydromethanopterin reductase-like flavin-dependent oxidoreductase (luciferase family)
MKFIYFMPPALPATVNERRSLRPIAHRTDYFQRMLDEVVELAQMAEELGFEAVAFPEHHLHTEGMEMGGLPTLYQHVINHTHRIKVGPIGYVLAGWNPLRLALEIAWLDQLSKGRTFCGFARGYQTRWLNQMAQKIHVSATTSDQSETDQINREAFEEVFTILKLAWADKPFRFKGKHYEYPYPYEEGTPWKPYEWTRELGAPGEVGENGRIQMIDVVPKPYQKPHPPLFQAFSVSESTIRWAAAEGVIPTLLISDLGQVRRFAQIYQEDSAKAGRVLARGENLGVVRLAYFGNNQAEALAAAEPGTIDQFFRKFAGVFGFWDAWRLPEDEAKYPAAKGLLPSSEWTLDRMMKSHFLLAGTSDDIRKEMDLLVEAGNPEWFALWSDQGALPLYEVKKQLELFGRKVVSQYR